MSDYELGQRVRYTQPLHRAFRDRGTPNVMRAWIPDNSIPSGEGVIVGKRLLANGTRYWEDEVGYIFQPKEYFTAYLITYAMHRKPVFVLPEHIEAAK